MLYYGKFHPFDKIWAEGSEYVVLAKKVIELERETVEIMSNLSGSEEYLATFDSLMQARSDLTTLVDKERFADGFRLGAMCMMDLWVSFEDFE